ncbi:type II toxin-antitoxin system HicB family antitoxin [Acidithiobacillus ferrooxidans]|jgi:predicted RNase H-like HicB family nuclease|uniref:type II toxin-antitoxin system HicB family antitoxin n=1 Tax=Acidithiobacillus ferrooxidans TaxID=920 RepID=UPI001C066DA6|nr:type II toxin-antitoxin system HicB family antitoxin [Acidithiobacillus ferrooxidans]MBU2856392.1 type II toxin-antitoxin system HicB family antitoxin [Acidithiobacillus ferrooxidans]MBU2860402.1 type II toxin-antitoxin system HicB family antitoxin [Acidithiobacillus ferrooxidans]
MNLHVEYEQEEDGRWIAEIPELPGALCYGASQVEAATRVEALALRVLAERRDKGEIAAFPINLETAGNALA